MNFLKRFSVKIFAVASLFAVLFVLLFSSIYVASESNHDCSGEDCTICFVIQLCEKAEKNLGSASFVSVSIVAIFAVSILILIAVSKNNFSQTLISQKIKLLN